MKCYKKKRCLWQLVSFFHTLVEMISRIYEPYELPLVISGGVFQNRVLLSLLLEKFPEAIFSNMIPPNDGGIALGQVMATCNALKD
jgi:hydrogenase maturation protein HypF